MIVTGLGIAIAFSLGLQIELPWFVLALLSSQVLMIAFRQGLRMWIDDQRRPDYGERVVVVGAGEAGAALVSQMLSDPRGGYIPVALVDDDRAKSKVVLHGVHVRGGISDIQEVVDDHGAVGVVVAIAQAPAEVFATLVNSLDLGRTWVRTIPSLADLLSDEVAISALRDMDVADLIGRQVIAPESEPIDRLINDTTVLVTGAGGSIGSELCRIIAQHSPARLVMLDRDESALHALVLSMDGRALMDSPDLVLADIRDIDSLDSVFDEVRPDLVVHAAALKHLPMLESYPTEAWKTNVHGTLNVLRAAQKYGAEHFVNISTDKAAGPTSELGRSKQLAERLTSHFAEATGKSYVSVRFGNVLGSRGSVLISFAEQIRRGGPITVTHPDVSRFFMTIPEACVLVLNAASDGAPGDTLVLDMGDPVRIVDIAQRMMTLAGRTCAISYTGLRDGEKLHEELFTPGEDAERVPSDRAWRIRVPAMEPDLLADPDATVNTIWDLYSEYVHDDSGSHGNVPHDAAEHDTGTPVPGSSVSMKKVLAGHSDHEEFAEHAASPPTDEHAVTVDAVSTVVTEAEGTADAVNDHAAPGSDMDLPDQHNSLVSVRSAAKFVDDALRLKEKI
ncbi:nucleoside-diphosphate sugar epimerase/dehydratase [Brevibacterium ammoniilyticum]|uniref:Nucleoside-diphosphate sugar epimerase/dehydratase n=1 Tax=Brevibacterium ammoniilyticum TaxID=1046555 RepID=A0ABP9U8W4_9MICO